MKKMRKLTILIFSLFVIIGTTKAQDSVTITNNTISIDLTYDSGVKYSFLKNNVETEIWGNGVVAIYDNSQRNVQLLYTLVKSPVCSNASELFDTLSYFIGDVSSYADTSGYALKAATLDIANSVIVAESGGDYTKISDAMASGARLIHFYPCSINDTIKESDFIPYLNDTIAIVGFNTGICEIYSSDDVISVPDNVHLDLYNLFIRSTGSGKSAIKIDSLQNGGVHLVETSLRAEEDGYTLNINYSDSVDAGTLITEGGQIKIDKSQNIRIHGLEALNNSATNLLYINKCDSLNNAVVLTDAVISGNISYSSKACVVDSSNVIISGGSSFTSKGDAYEQTGKCYSILNSLILTSTSGNDIDLPSSTTSGSNTVEYGSIRYTTKNVHANAVFKPINKDVDILNTSSWDGFTWYDAANNSYNRFIQDSTNNKDSLAVHLDTLQVHNTRINNNVDSLAVHLDTLQAHNTRINNNVDSLSVHLDSLQSHNTRINSIVDSLANIYTEAQVNTLLGAKTDTSLLNDTLADYTITGNDTNYVNTSGDTIYNILYAKGDVHLTTDNGKTLITDVSTTKHTVNIRANAGKSGYLSFTEDATADRWVIASETGSDTLKFSTGSTTSYTDRVSLLSTGILFEDQGSSVNSLSLKMIADNAGTQQTGTLQTIFGVNPYIRLSAPNAAGTATPTMDMRSDLVSWFNGEAGVDYQFNFNGETNDGTITYMEDEDRFDFDNDVKITGEITSNVIRGQLYDSLTNTTHIDIADTYYIIDTLIDTLSNGIIITDSSMTLIEAGVYIYMLSASYTHGTNNTIVHISLFIDDVDFVPFEGERKIGTGGDFGFSGGSGVYVSDGTEVLKLKVKCDNTGILTINHLNFTLIRIG